ncbi:hypothetical protein Anapl_02784 [Anas platyrhynchos]|uniref:Uncharacterized protein n=1 Tax=Anas platyrhynchos TaxID=8839 RepID=R0K3G8_ANAPL|nr:hypothetical protein Anapl_02784 [Anas platyrhynchos]
MDFESGMGPCLQECVSTAKGNCDGSSISNYYSLFTPSVSDVQIQLQGDIKFQVWEGSVNIVTCAFLALDLRACPQCHQGLQGEILWLVVRVYKIDVFTAQVFSCIFRFTDSVCAYPHCVFQQSPGLNLAINESLLNAALNESPGSSRTLTVLEQSDVVRPARCPAPRPGASRAAVWPSPMRDLQECRGTEMQPRSPLPLPRCPPEGLMDTLPRPLRIRQQGSSGQVSQTGKVILTTAPADKTCCVEEA